MKEILSAMANRPYCLSNEQWGKFVVQTFMESKWIRTTRIKLNTIEHVVATLWDILMYHFEVSMKLKNKFKRNFLIWKYFLNCRDFSLLVFNNQIRSGGITISFEWKMTPSTCHIAQWPVVKLEISLKYQTQSLEVVHVSAFIRWDQRKKTYLITCKWR